MLIINIVAVYSKNMTQFGLSCTEQPVEGFLQQDWIEVYPLIIDYRDSEILKTSKEDKYNIYQYIEPYINRSFLPNFTKTNVL